MKWRGETIFETPTGEVTRVTLACRGPVVAAAAMELCLHRGIAMTLSGRHGRPFARVSSVTTPASAGLNRTLLRAGQTRAGTALAVDILIGKLRNQQALLLYYAKARGRSLVLRDHLKAAAASVRAQLPELRQTKRPLRVSRADLFLIEARAAARYWSALGRLVPAAFAFPGRRGRDATDVTNALLNYGYHRLLHLVLSAVERTGLLPWFGVLHTGRRRSPALALDLMEPFRPLVVDRVVFGLLGRGFVPSVRPNGRLTALTLRTFERAFDTNLQRTSRQGTTLEALIREHAVSFRRALEDDGRLHCEVLSW